VATGADGVTSALNLETMGVVAVAARDAGMVHLALQKRPVLIYLILDLAVGIIQALVQQRRTMRIHKWSARHIAVV
jgi:hypothetical protein